MAQTRLPIPVKSLMFAALLLWVQVLGVHGKLVWRTSLCAIDLTWFFVWVLDHTKNWLIPDCSGVSPGDAWGAICSAGI